MYVFSLPRTDRRTPTIVRTLRAQLTGIPTLGQPRQFPFPFKKGKEEKSFTTAGGFFKCLSSFFLLAVPANRLSRGDRPFGRSRAFLSRSLCLGRWEISTRALTENSLLLEKERGCPKSFWYKVQNALSFHPALPLFTRKRGEWKPETSFLVYALRQGFLFHLNLLSCDLGQQINSEFFGGRVIPLQGFTLCP